MSDVNWRREMKEMLCIIERQATYSLTRIGKSQSLNDEFQQLFLRMSNERLATTYTRVKMKLNNTNQDKHDKGKEQAGVSVSELLDPFGNRFQCGNSLGVDLDPQHNQNTNDVNISDSVKQEVNEANEVDDVVEIFDTSDEEDNVELSGMQLSKIKHECENGNDNEIKLNASMNDGNSVEVHVKYELDDGDIPIRTFHPNGNSTNDRNIQVNNPKSSLGLKGTKKTAEADLATNQKSNEVRIKEEFDIEPKQEVIDEDIPIRMFNPNDVSSNGGYSASNDVAIRNSAGSSSRLTDGKWKPSGSRDAKQFNCELCEYGTDYKGNLNMHMRKHTNEKPFQCSRCYKFFAYSCNLNRHMVTHKGEFPFHCPNCFCGFFQDNEKIAHEKNCRIRRYECYVCKYFTTQKITLVRHMLTHSGNKPFRCTLCSKRSICKKYVTGNRSHMARHMRSHTGEKPFRCEVCMKHFTQKCNLKKHMNTVHNRCNL